MSSGEVLEKIEQLRRQINEIDSQIVELLGRRADIVIEIGELKKSIIFPHISQKEKERY